MTEKQLRRLRRCSWGVVYALLAVSLLLAALPETVRVRLARLPADALRESSLAWARWLAGRNGVDLLTRGEANPDAPTVALTFDDGPHRETGTAILDVLHRWDVPATFFVVGVRAREHPEILRRMVREGHEIGNHTWAHLRLTTLPPEKARREICSLQEYLDRVVGVRPTLCRPPGGTYDARVLGICRDEGFRICLWSVNAGDWMQEMTAQRVADRVLERIHPGAIVLMHDETPATPEALPTIIRALRERGYRFLTVSEMLPTLPPAHPTGGVVHLGRQ